MKILKKDWGYSSGYKIYHLTLENKNGMRICLTNYGATLISAVVPDKNGVFKDVLLGYDDLAGFEKGTVSQGAIIGRYANRIRDGKFTLNGIEYKLNIPEGQGYCLHGGKNNYGKRVWTLDKMTEGAEPTVTFGLISPDGEEGFPATVKIKVTYTLTENNEVKIDYYAFSDGDTVLNLTNHAYFNLKGYNGGSVLDTEIQIFTDKYTPVDEIFIPLGIASVKGTPYNFTEPKTIRKAIEEGLSDGVDHNFFLGEPHIMRKAAEATERETGRVLTVFTDKPAVHLYTGNGLDEQTKNGAWAGKQTAFCFETQFNPNSPNTPEFPSSVLRKGDEYRFSTIFKFSVLK